MPQPSAADQWPMRLPQRTGSASAIRPPAPRRAATGRGDAGGRHNDGGVRHYVGMVSSANWLDRYRAGQRHQVWHELRQLGAAVREPGLSEQAQLVCDEMARRARRNIEVIISGSRARDTASTPTTMRRNP